MLKLFMRYQMDFKILKNVSHWSVNRTLKTPTHEANGVTPIPAPTSKTVS